MKTNQSFRFLIAVSGAIALLTAAQAGNEQVSPRILPPTNATVTISVTGTGTARKTAIPAAVATGPDVGLNRWIEIKDLPYNSRSRFFTGLAGLESRVDGEIAELTAQRAAMSITAYTEDWDFAMKEMIASRSYLRSTGQMLRQAKPETWDQQKERVGVAWVRTQEAYSKFKSITTSWFTMIKPD
jgi:hypothetical protein